jgi:hypothetical protein
MKIVSAVMNRHKTILYSSGMDKRWPTQTTINSFYLLKDVLTKLSQLMHPLHVPNITTERTITRYKNPA